jgi:cytochrome c oxidase subunit 4
MTDAGRNNARRAWWLWQAPAVVLVVLLILFGASLGSAYLPLGTGNLTANLVIAAVMIVLLVIFLMDLKSATALIRVVAAAGLLWLILMFALTFNDYLLRYY